MPQQFRQRHGASGIRHAQNRQFQNRARMPRSINFCRRIQSNTEPPAHMPRISLLGHGA